MERNLKHCAKSYLAQLIQNVQDPSERRLLWNELSSSTCIQMRGFTDYKASYCNACAIEESKTTKLIQNHFHYVPPPWNLQIPICHGCKVQPVGELSTGDNCSDCILRIWQRRSAPPIYAPYNNYYNPAHNPVTTTIPVTQPETTRNETWRMYEDWIQRANLDDNSNNKTTNISMDYQTPSTSYQTLPAPSYEISHLHLTSSSSSGSSAYTPKTCMTFLSFDEDNEKRPVTHGGPYTTMPATNEETEPNSISAVVLPEKPPRTFTSHQDTRNTSNNHGELDFETAFLG